MTHYTNNTIIDHVMQVSYNLKLYYYLNTFD